MQVKDVMHAGVDCVEAGTPVRDVARLMREDDIGAIPVSSSGELVGMITDRDVACRAVGDGLDLDELKASAIMTEGAICCSPNDDLADAVELMEKHRIRRLPVLDDGSLIGMVSLGDISRRAPTQLSGELLKAVSGHHRSRHQS